MVFIEDSTNVGNNLKMGPSGRNESLTMVIVGEASKSFACDDSQDYEEQVGDHLVINEEVFKIPVENDSRVERFGKDERGN